jgi:hypothetical protein
VGRQNNLSYLRENLDESVCDVCQKAKSHQLPFPKSLSVCTVSLALCSLMYGVLPPFLSEDSSILFLSLMILGNSPGFIKSNKNLMSFINSMTSNNLLNVNLIGKSLHSKLIAKVSIRNSHHSSNVQASHTTSRVHTHINRMARPNVNTDT